MNGDKSDKEEVEEEEGSGNEENFMTIDSVGDVDGRLLSNFLCFH